MHSSVRVNGSRVSASNEGGGGVQKVWGVCGSPREEKKQSFKFWCPKWPILPEMTVKYEIYFYFFCQQGGDIPPVVLSGGVRTRSDPPLGGSPVTP